jgi:hypothetical protein
MTDSRTMRDGQILSYIAFTGAAECLKIDIVDTLAITVLGNPDATRDDSRVAGQASSS